jgi:hypothetical protein
MTDSLAELERRIQRLEARNTPQPFYNVKKYGAVGNGTHDDAAAIQLAVDAWMDAGKGILKFPAGYQYVIEDSVIFEPPTPGATLSKPMIIDGAGAEILVNVTAVPGFWFRGPSAADTWWAGLVVRGLQLGCSGGTPTHAILFDDSNANNIQMYQFSLENLRIIDFPIASNGLSLINKFEYQLLNVYVRQDAWTSGTAPAGNCVNMTQASVGSSQQHCQVYANNLNTAFGFNALYTNGVDGVVFVGSTFSGAYAQGVRGISSNNMKYDQMHMEGNWRGHDDYVPPDTNAGGFNTAGLYAYGGSYEIDVTSIEEGAFGVGEYRVEGFFTGSSIMKSHMASSGHDGHVLSLYDYGSADTFLTTIGIKLDDITFQDVGMIAKTNIL